MVWNAAGLQARDVAVDGPGRDLQPRGDGPGGERPLASAQKLDDIEQAIGWPHGSLVTQAW
jgi:hypothetical protein